MLLIDIGNTAIKAAIMKSSSESDDIVEFQRIDGHSIKDLRLHDDEVVVCSTIGYDDEIDDYFKDKNIKKLIKFDYTTPIPIKNLYKTPRTLGPDRLAAAIGANGIFPDKDILIIDMGTAITYDFVNSAGEYLGGNISPGMEMRFKALNKFTSKLPLVDKNGEIPFIGYDTETALRCGVIDGIKCEIEGIIRKINLKTPNLYVFFTGGDAFDFDYSIKNRIFADKNLLFKGLRRIFEYNRL